MKTVSKAINESLSNYYAITEEIKLLTKQKANYKEFILSKMVENSLESINFTAVLSSAPRISLDTKAVRLLLGPELPKYQKEIIVESLKVIPKAG